MVSNFESYEAGSTSNQCVCKGLSIAAYFSPRSHPELWDKITASFPATQMIIYDRDDQSGADPIYKSRICQMKQIGIRVFGYVNSGFGAIDPANIKENIDNHRAFYNVTDIMFDNARTITANIPYYKELADYVHGPLTPTNRVCQL